MEPEIGIGYREVHKGEKIPANHEFWSWGRGPWANCPERTGDIYTNGDRLCRVPCTKPTQKPKEPKTMQTKKPGTSHGKPTAKGLRVEKKPTAAKVSKYPAPREALGIMIPDYRNPKSKATKADLVDQVFDLLDTALDARKDLATTGTKLDRALVDLKEAKKRIKELTKGTEAAK